MKQIFKISIISAFIMSIIWGCQSGEETPTPTQPKTLISRAYSKETEVLFEYDATNRLSAFRIKWLGDEYIKATYTYLSDGRIDLIKTQGLGVEGQYKLTWSSKSDATIKGTHPYNYDFTASLKTNANGYPTELARLSGDGGFQSEKYSFSYDSKNNFIEIEPNLNPILNLGKLVSNANFDDKKSPFSQSFVPLTLLNVIEWYGLEWLSNLPMGAINNPKQQKFGNNRLWEYTYTYNENGYPTQIDIAYSRLNTTPITKSSNSFKLEYITK